jgi:type I restriction enzyme S subunit
MSWVIVELSDLADFRNGLNFSKESFGRGISVINVSDFKNRRIPDYKNLPQINPDGIVKSSDLLCESDVLFVRSNGNKDLVGRSLFIENLKEDVTFSGFCIRCRFIRKEEIFPKFYSYIFKTNIIRKTLSNTANGANITNLNQGILSRLEVPVPPLQTQKRIADILGAYDDLIENNLKRIKLLEQAAQNIYKEWFTHLRFPGHENVDINEKSGLPVGWNQDFLDNQLDKARRIGKLKKDDYLEFGDFPIIDQSNGFIGGYSNDRKVVQFEPLPLVIFGDHTRRVKYVNFPFISGADGTQLLSPLNKNMLPAYFYLSIKSIDLSDYAYARHYKYLKQQTIIIPNDSILKLFNDKVCPMLEQGIKLLSYNTKLKTARDILLPRLMNRTIEV